jgi:hypothetical protein
MHVHTQPHALRALNRQTATASCADTTPLDAAPNWTICTSAPPRMASIRHAESAIRR